MDPLTLVSSDSHAVMPPEAWPEYLEREYHHLLPELRAENSLSREVLGILRDAVLTPALYDVFDAEGLYRAGRDRGLWDLEVRLEEMDRDGIAAELVHHGDFRVVDLFHNVMNASYALEAWDAGARAYNRWAADAFGAATGRLLLVGAMGSCADLDASVAELEWIADHGFVGTYAPGFMSHPGLPPLDDPSWDRWWSCCAERELAVVVHGGYGLSQGYVYPRMAQPFREVRASGGSDQDLLLRLSTDIFNSEFVTDVRSRRAMWQLMLGGVFDRHPKLRLVMTEVRADWLPATLQLLDARFEEHRADLPASRAPSEYWRSNCLAGLSFTHRAEVEMRDEIGVDTIAFGRDYPHTEGTWPNTREWMQVTFAGVPEDDLRAMAGENAIRFFDLDRARLDEIAARVGPSVAEVTGSAAAVSPELVAHLELRCGLHKPAESDAKFPTIEPMLRDDLARVGAGAVRH